MQLASAAVVADGSVQTVLHGPRSIGAPPAARLSAAAVSWRTSWRRWSPCGATHIASSADRASSTATLTSGCPHTVRDPAVARMLAGVVGGGLLRADARVEVPCGR